MAILTYRHFNEFPDFAFQFSNKFGVFFSIASRLYCGGLIPVTERIGTSPIIVTESPECLVPMEKPLNNVFALRKSSHDCEEARFDKLHAPFSHEGVRFQGCQDS